MGTHPIFESDFDCLTDPRKKLLKFPNQISPNPKSNPQDLSNPKNQLKSRLTNRLRNQKIWLKSLTKKQSKAPDSRMTPKVMISRQIRKKSMLGHSMIDSRLISPVLPLPPPNRSNRLKMIPVKSVRSTGSNQIIYEKPKRRPVRARQVWTLLHLQEQ